jgi:hypothetical protein
MMEVVLAADDWNAEPPGCPACAARAMRQEFKPVAIGGSPYARARAIAEDIIDKDYHVADMQRDKHERVPAVRYKDATSEITPSAWAAHTATLEQAIAIGRKTRLQHGNGLDVLHSALKSGAQPDLIEASKRRAMKVW